MKERIVVALAIVALMVTGPCCSGTLSSSKTQQQTSSENGEASLTCYLSGMPRTVTVSRESAEHLQALFNALAVANAKDAQSKETRGIQDEILHYAESLQLLPPGMTADEAHAQLTAHGQSLAQRASSEALPQYDGTGHEHYCNFVSWGEGGAKPIIILPRLIPILMIPIPRVYVGWATDDGVTSVGGLRSGTGFYAMGAQKGMALGFWGIGFSIFLPPVRAYGMFGYALYAQDSAEEMEYYPPNNPPEISAVYPMDGAKHVPLSTTELSFALSDLDSDAMSYSVTTIPDIGGGNGIVHDGTYQVPISGLVSSTTYSWHVQATDGKDTVSDTFSFTTEYLAPVITDIVPRNGATYQSINLTSLNFTLHDYQNDPMDWTVQTYPNIGNGSGTDVPNGQYTVPISGLEYNTSYTWYLNATDGTYPNHLVLRFKTTPEGGVPHIFAAGKAKTISRYWKSDLHKDMDSPNCGSLIYSMIGDDAFLYVGGGQGTNTVGQYWISNLTKHAESPSCGDEVFDICQDENFIYALSRSAVVSKFDKATMSLVGESEYLGAYARAMTCDGTYLYVGGEPGHVTKLQMSDLQVVGTSQSVGGQIWELATDGTYIYAGGDNQCVVRLLAADLSACGQTSSYGGEVRSIAPVGEYLYVGGISPGQPYQYWASNLTLKAVGSAYGKIFRIIGDTNSIYVAGEGPNTIYQYSPTDMSLIQTGDNYGDTIEGLWCADIQN
jgi:hypothetical protein